MSIIDDDLAAELSRCVEMFDGTPHGEFLVKLTTAIGHHNEDMKALADCPELPLSQRDVMLIRQSSRYSAEILELCDSHEVLRLRYEGLQTAIANHQFDILDGRRITDEVDAELWANVPR